MKKGAAVEAAFFFSGAAHCSVHHRRAQPGMAVPQKRRVTRSSLKRVYFADGLGRPSLLLSAVKLGAPCM